MTCRWCKKKYNKPLIDGKVTSCPHCEGVYPDGVSRTLYKDTPDKGSDRWYKEKWYMKNEKTLNEDIRSRHTTDGGKTVIRVDEKGNRKY